MLQKSKRVLITLQDKVEKEIKKTLSRGHIEKLERCLDKYFI